MNQNEFYCPACGGQSTIGPMAIFASPHDPNLKCSACNTLFRIMLAEVSASDPGPDDWNSKHKLGD